MYSSVVLLLRPKYHPYYCDSATSTAGQVMKKSILTPTKPQRTANVAQKSGDEDCLGTTPTILQL